MVLALDPSVALGQQLLWPNLVLVRFSDAPAGSGMTDSGLWIEHSERLPAIFGTVVAVGSKAAAAGITPGRDVLFIRYAGEIDTVLEDGTTFCVFEMNDIIAALRRDRL